MGWTGCSPRGVGCGTSAQPEPPHGYTPRTTSTALSVIGVDFGKDVFHLVGFDHRGKVAFRRKIKRHALVETFKALSPCIVGMEACLSAPLVAHRLRQLRHEPRLIPAKDTRPFAKGQKNDDNDAAAALRLNLRTGREKSQDELDRQADHRVRSRLVSRRTATVTCSATIWMEVRVAA